MKNLLITITLISTQITMAAGRPVPRIIEEPVTVRKATFVGDMMPPAPEQPRLRLILQVGSGGCTDSNSFKVVTTETATTTQISVVRTKVDPCEAYFREGTEVELEVRNINLGKKFKVMNPLFVVDNTTH